MPGRTAEPRARLRAPRVGARSSGRSRKLATRLGAYQSGGLLVALIILCAVFTALSGKFFTHSNLVVVLLQVSVVGLVAVPQAMLVLSGYVDLSVGSVAVLGVAVFGEVAKVHGQPLAVAIVAALAAGAAWGVVNAVLICYLDFSPIIVTLGGYAAARGVADYITKDVTQFGFGDAFGWLGNGDILSIPVPAVIFFLAVLIGAYIWYEMPTGRHMTAIGADRSAARSMGVHVRRIPAVVYVVSGLSAAAGGLILTSELDGSSLSIGLGLELQVLTAVLLGGVAFAGGRGSLWGVLFGVLFVGVLNNGLVLLNISPFVTNIAVGGVLLLAAGADAFYQRLERVPVQIDDDAEPEAVAGSPASAEAHR